MRGVEDPVGRGASARSKMSKPLLPEPPYVAANLIGFEGIDSKRA